MAYFFALIFVIQSLGYIQTPIPQQIYANNSPSFVRQEFVDASDDWQFWKVFSNTTEVNTHKGKEAKVDIANNLSECKINNDFISPDVQSVSYISNGKTLNATVWLTSPFEEPPSNDTVDIFQEQFKVTIAKTNLTLNEYIDKNMINVSHLFDPLRDLVENSTTIDGNQAYRVVYTDKQSQLKVMQIWTIKGDKAYNSTYSAIPDEYDNYYFAIIKNILDTFEIESFDKETLPEIQSETNFLTYEGSGIRIRYPGDWVKQEDKNVESTTITFRSPFDDKREPSWHEITFSMAIDIDSVHDAGTDYRVVYSRIPYDVWTGNWTRQLREVSAYDKIRVLEEQNNYAFYDKVGPYILFSFDLDKINLPQQYKAVFYVTDYFVKNHRLCRLIDTTNWVIVPPPEFSMSSSPNSVVLRPNDLKNIELQIKGNTDLESEAVLGAGNSSKDIEIDFIPNKISIPASGSGTATLQLKALDTAKPKPYTFPILANISFPTSITNRGGETFSNNRSMSLLESSNLTLTVLPAYTSEERLSNFINAWITPIQGLWTFLAGVGAVIAPLIISLYRKKQKRRNEENKD
jgi:hypothetical protein